MRHFYLVTIFTLFSTLLFAEAGRSLDEGFVYTVIGFLLLIPFSILASIFAKNDNSKGMAIFALVLTILIFFAAIITLVVSEGEALEVALFLFSIIGFNISRISKFI